VGCAITLDGSGSTDTDGTITLYEWDLDGDGQYDDATGATAIFNATAVGTFTVGLRVTDDDGALDTDAATVNVADIVEPNRPPHLARPIPDQAAPANRRFRFALSPDTFVDPDAGQTMTYAAAQADGSPLPAWLVFDSPTRTFSGMPLVRDVRRHEIRVTATDSGSPALAASAEFTINVTGHPFPFQNADLPPDVDGSELVTPLDVLIVINWINGNGAGPAPDSAPESADGAPCFVDVSGDNLVSPIDVLMVVNHLNNPPSPVVQPAEGEAVSGATISRATTTDPLQTASTANLRAVGGDEVFAQSIDPGRSADEDELLEVLAVEADSSGMGPHDLVMAEIGGEVSSHPSILMS
jgi:PKD repeat protein